jgi:hypothetical protein
MGLNRLKLFFQVLNFTAVICSSKFDANEGLVLPEI